MNNPRAAADQERLVRMVADNQVVIMQALAALLARAPDAHGLAHDLILDALVDKSRETQVCLDEVRNRRPLG